MLRIGVIGAAGRGHLGDYAHRPAEGVSLAAGADVLPAARERFLERCSKKFGMLPAVYGDYREMIEKEHLDGVIIASPDYLHEEQALFALEHKVAVFLEKPMAITTEGADRILEAAWRNRTKLVVGHNMRYMEFPSRMKELVDSGVIGEVRSVWCRHFVSYGGDAYFRRWHAAKRNSTSLLLQKGSHDIDVIHWLAGGFSTLVNGLGNLSVYDKVPRRPAGEELRGDLWSESHWPPLEQQGFYPEVEVEDLSLIQMRLDNGVLATYQQCHYTPDACRNYTVIGTKGRLENYGDSAIQVWTRRQDHFRLEGDITYRVGAAAGDHGGADPLIIRSFIGALKGEYFVRSTAQAARHSVAAGCAGAESIRSGGRPVAIPPLPEYLIHFDFTRAKEA